MVEPGRVLVAPAGQHTLITGEQTIALIPSGDRPPFRPSADMLLTTLATSVQARAIAVALSGQGNDAATGATAVHRFGGTVIVSSPETSTRSSMPGATMARDDVTDHVVSLDDIPALITALATTPLILSDDPRRIELPADQLAVNTLDCPDRRRCYCTRT